ncbi:MAG TPA: nitrile hydratase subunit alpha [Candidatus Acidoferrales bacterium]|nr:nitrile hydratase subunit alpha [Candidatus Acidoferrales bacterium]
MSDDHDHPHHPEHHLASTYHEKLTAAVIELLTEKQLLSPEKLTAAIDIMDTRGPNLGAKVVARAWTDPEFKKRLLADGSKACAELGIDVGSLKLVVVENTPQAHNVIVCTLCSCYPKMLLGIPPAWYKSKAYRARTAREPRKVLHEFGLDVDDKVAVRVHDSTADMRYLVLPMRPAGTEGWSEEKLADLVTRDSMIGVAQANEPMAV